MDYLKIILGIATVRAVVRTARRTTSRIELIAPSKGQQTIGCDDGEKVGPFRLFLDYIISWALIRALLVLCTSFGKRKITYVVYEVAFSSNSM